jgi:hypothetical protein
MTFPRHRYRAAARHDPDVVGRLRQLEAADPAAHFHVGSMGSGSALWATLRVGYRRTWRLFTAKKCHLCCIYGYLLADASTIILRVNEGRLLYDPAMDEREQARDELHAATPPGWHVGRPTYHDEPVKGGFS